MAPTLPVKLRGMGGLTGFASKNLLWQVSRHEDDLIIEIDGHPKINFLSIGYLVDITKKMDNNSAQALHKALQSELDEQGVKPPSQINIFKEFGDIGNLDAIRNKLVFTKGNQRTDTFIRDLLPLLSRIGATQFVSIKCDALHPQAYTSLFKISLLKDRVGFEEAQRLATKKDVLRDVLPNALSIIGYLEPFCLFLPRATTLPITTFAHAAHFIKDGGWPLPSTLVYSFSDLFGTDLHPGSPNISFNDALTFRPQTADCSWKYLAMLVEAVNAFFDFALAPDLFLLENRYLDVLKYIQFISGVDLIFADFKSLAYSPNPHSRTTFSFRVVDKLANLACKYIGWSGKNEPSIARALLTAETAEHLQDALKKSRIGLHRPELIRQLAEALIEKNTQLHNELRQQLSADDKEDETKRLERLSFHRNHNAHGTFLNREQFENLFLESSGMIPAALPATVQALMLAFTIIPHEFLSLPLKLVKQQ